MGGLGGPIRAPCRQFVREGLVVDEAPNVREGDGLLKVLQRLPNVAANSCALGFDQSDAMGEILYAPYSYRDLS